MKLLFIALAFIAFFLALLSTAGLKVGYNRCIAAGFCLYMIAVAIGQAKRVAVGLRNDQR